MSGEGKERKIVREKEEKKEKTENDIFSSYCDEFKTQSSYLACLGILLKILMSCGCSSGDCSSSDIW